MWLDFRPLFWAAGLAIVGAVALGAFVTWLVLS